MFHCTGKSTNWDPAAGGGAVVARSSAPPAESGAELREPANFRVSVDWKVYQKRYLLFKISQKIYSRIM